MDAAKTRPGDTAMDWPSRAECRTPERRARTQAQSQSGCFVCGQRNSRGLRLHFVSTGEGVYADWTPPPDLEGFRGIIHGGIVSTVLDEAMSKSVIALHAEALTAELRVRFRQPLRSGVCIRVMGWVTRKQGRRIQTEASLLDHRGMEIAHAWAKFLVLPGCETRENQPSES